jgi:peptidoglycan/LPS O-acetylase OafA/YrhL
MSTSYFDNLTGVRGVAAAVVPVSHLVQVHFLSFSGFGTPLHQISSITSEYAVVVFFILSGYLITHAFEANTELYGKLRLGAFAAARFARLYPPFLFAIGVSLAVFALLDVFSLRGRSSPLSLPSDACAAREVVHLSISEIRNALFMKQGLLEINGPLWSLYMEAKLYVLYACALALASGRRGLAQTIALAVVFFLVARSGLENNPGFAGYAAVWLTGVLAYYVWNDRNGWRNRFLLCCGLIAFIIVAQGWHEQQSGGAPWRLARDVLAAAVIAWPLFKLRIRVTASRRLADCSYSLYVTHFPVLLLAQSLLISTGSVSVVAAIGGALEAKKSAVQNWLLASGSSLRRLGESS